MHSENPSAVIRCLVNVTGVSSVVAVALDGLGEAIRRAMSTVAQTMAVAETSVAVAKTAIAVAKTTIAQSVAETTVAAVSESVAQSSAVQTSIQTQSSSRSFQILSFGFFSFFLDGHTNGASDQGEKSQNLKHKDNELQFHLNDLKL